MSNALRKKANLEAMKIEAIVRQEQKRAYEVGLNDGCAKTLVLIDYVLHHKFGFGEQRLHRIVDEVQYLSDCMDEGLVEMKDLHEVLVDECHFDIYKARLVESDKVEQEQDE